MSLQAIQEKTQQTHSNLLANWTPVFEKFQDIVTLLNANGEIVHHNFAWQKISLPHMHSIFGATFQHWIHPEDILLLQKVFLSHQSQKLTVRLINAKQKTMWFELNIQPIFEVETSHQLLGWCILGTELTEKIRTDEQIFAQTRSINGLLSRLPVMLYRSRNDWNWTMDYVSHGCVHLTGYTHQELLNTPLYGKLIHAEDQQYVWDSIQCALQNHTIFNIRYRLHHLQDKIQYVCEVGQGLYSQTDMLLGIEGAIFFD